MYPHSEEVECTPIRVLHSLQHSGLSVYMHLSLDPGQAGIQYGVPEGFPTAWVLQTAM